MKRIAIAFAALLMLAGCGTLGSVVTGDTANPVTPTAAKTLRAAFIAGIVIPAGEYADLPRCSRNPPPCSKQAVVDGLRRYINPLSGTMKQLDAWANGNTSLNGPALYQAATIAIQTTKAFAKANGVPGVN